MQQVIVYNTPIQAAFWDAVMSGVTGANFIPVMCGMIVFFAVLIATDHILLKTVYRRKFCGGYFPVFAGAVTAIFTTWYMWI